MGTLVRLVQSGPAHYPKIDVSFVAPPYATTSVLRGDPGVG